MGELLGDMARASRGELVRVNEESTVGIAGVEGQHPVVDVLLGALGLVAGGEKAAGRVRGLAGLEPGSLGVVVVTIAVVLGDVLEDNAPISLNVDSPLDLGVVDMGGAEVALGSDPVAGIIGGGALGSTSVVVVVEGVLLVGGDVLDEVVGRLVGDVAVLLQEDRVLADLVGDVVGRVLGVLQAEGEVGVEGARGRGLGITVAVGGRVGGGVRGVGGGMMGGGMMGDWVVRGGRVRHMGVGGGSESQGEGDHHSGDLKIKKKFKKFLDVF